LEQSGYEAIAVGGYGAARPMLERALALREAVGETDSLAVSQAAIALGWALRYIGDFEAALAALARGLAGARRGGDRAAEAEALAKQSRVLDDLGRYDEADALIETALQLGRANSEAPIGFILAARAVHATRTGDLDRATSLAAESLERARAGGDPTGETDALNMLGFSAGLRHDLKQAAQYYEAALSVARDSGNLSQEALMLGNLGYLTYKRGDYAAARAYALAALEGRRDLGEKAMMVYDLGNLAQANLRLGDVAAARLGTRETLSLARSLGMTPGILWGLSLVGQVLAAEGQAERALALFGLTHAHPALDHQDKLELDEAIAGLELPEAKVDAELAAGAVLDLETVVREILDGEW
jgi:tetratricopeptide (TPR) repeat protein